MRKMEKGDSIFIYTDGVTEAMNKKSQQYSNQRLFDLMVGMSRQNVKNVPAEVRRDLTAFVDDAVQSDDITMIMLKSNV